MANSTAARKTDRRTLYTIGVIKDAMLALMETTPYEKISVTALCREAEIARATFYLHFDSVDQVLDSVIDDALLFSEEAQGNLMDLVDIIQSGDTNRLRENESILPACQRIADSDRYHKLFMDSYISEHIIRRIAAHEHDVVVPKFMERCNLSEEDAELLFMFILHGTFSVNRSMKWQKTDRWYRFQGMLGAFIEAGMGAVK